MSRERLELLYYLAVDEIDALRSPPKYSNLLSEKFNLPPAPAKMLSILLDGHPHSDERLHYYCSVNNDTSLKSVGVAASKIRAATGAKVTRISKFGYRMSREDIKMVLAKIGENYDQ